MHIKIGELGRTTHNEINQKVEREVTNPTTWRWPLL